ncbi:DUF7638 domain-containing protein [Chondromyces crocatus]|uniref:Uncharacterized protein n=1 Tax=Chondromyces crocatus TaxID=52 RepID=A0A0K1EHU6_CHOCO|nr:hypothetical protein [Chondromyces crocatus]AKT40429.1 uncharacterized protein CMC5_045820 [Chondromyces crocatus]
MLAVDESMGAWQMVSTRGVRRRGWCIPILIQNMQHHLTPLCVFEDGVVDCWELLDVPLFRRKLTTGWIATSAPVGARLSVFHLGAATIDAFEPLLALGEVAARVMAAIRHWNPGLLDLVDLRGSATEPHGRISRDKLPDRRETHFRQALDGSRVLAKSVSVFVKQSDALRLTQWFVYADGKSRLGPEGVLVELGVVEEAVLDEKVVFSVPDATWVELDGLGRAKLSRGHWFIDPIESIKEQRAHLAELRGGMEITQICTEAWEDYLRSPTPDSIEVLRKAYFDVPEHLRVYCARNMDNKDSEIKVALGLRGYRNDKR